MEDRLDVGPFPNMATSWLLFYLIQSWSKVVHRKSFIPCQIQHNPTQGARSVLRSTRWARGEHQNGKGKPLTCLEIQLHTEYVHMVYIFRTRWLSHLWETAASDASGPATALRQTRGILILHERNTGSSRQNTYQGQWKKATSTTYLPLI